MYEDLTSHDQVPPEVGPDGPVRRSGVHPRLLLQVLPQGFHPTPALPPPGPPRVPQARLPWAGAGPQGMGRTPRRAGAGQGPRPLDDPEGGRAAARKRGTAALLRGTVRRARARRLIPEKSKAAIDATGYETRHISRYFAWRSGRRKQRAWPKLTAVLETCSHLFLSAHVSRGPSQDSPQFRPAVRAAAGCSPIDTLLADGAFDAEHNHALARERLGIRSTLIPLNRR